MKISAVFVLMGMVFAANTQASPVFKIVNLDFEGAGNRAYLGSFYNGGSDSQGNSGDNFGVSFSNNAQTLIDWDAGGSGNFANEPSPSTVLFAEAGSLILNYAPGFSDFLQFYFSSAIDRPNAVVNVFDGLNASGNVLASFELPAQAYYECSGDSDGTFCNWGLATAALSGTGRSIEFGAGSSPIDYQGRSGWIGYDNISFVSVEDRFNQVPLPGTLALLGVGLVGLATGSRRLRLNTADVLGG